MAARTGQAWQRAQGRHDSTDPGRPLGALTLLMPFTR